MKCFSKSFLKEREGTILQKCSLAKPTQYINSASSLSCIRLRNGNTGMRYNGVHNIAHIRPHQEKRYIHTMRYTRCIRNRDSLGIADFQSLFFRPFSNKIHYQYFTIYFPYCQVFRALTLLTNCHKYDIIKDNKLKMGSYTLFKKK